MNCSVVGVRSSSRAGYKAGRFKPPASPIKPLRDHPNIEYTFVYFSVPLIRKKNVLIE